MHVTCFPSLFASYLAPPSRPVVAMSTVFSANSLTYSVREYVWVSLIEPIIFFEIFSSFSSHESGLFSAVFSPGAGGPLFPK